MGEQMKKKRGKLDVFDVVGAKMARCLVETAYACDVMKEPFRSGGICALEEFHFRFTGQHFDWEEFKIADAKFRERGPRRPAARGK